MVNAVVECSRCKKAFPQKKIVTICPECKGALIFRFNLKAAKKNVSRDDIEIRHETFWKFLEFLPISSPKNIVTLGEPYTPILKLEDIAEGNSRNIYVKDDGRLPTGTFKARGMAVAVSCLKELGVKRVAIPSAGNAAIALACYGIKAGMDVYAFLPKDVPNSILRECVSFGAKIYLVDGLIDDAAGIVDRLRPKYGWFDLSTSKQPYRFEGYKAIAFEVAEQFNWNPPDCILFPTGGGEGIIGLWKGFKELKELGWTEKIPRLIAIQSAGCAPIVKAFEDKKSEVDEKWENANTIAIGLRVPRPYASYLLLKALRETGGAVVAVDDKEIHSSIDDLFLKGLHVCPEAAATLAGMQKLLKEEVFDPDEKILLYLTGSGLIYSDTITVNRSAFPLLRKDATEIK